MQKQTNSSALPIIKNTYKIPNYSDKFKDILQSVDRQEQTSQIKNHKQEYQITNDKHNKQKQYFFYRIKSIGVGYNSFVYLIQQQQTHNLYAQKSISKKHIEQNKQDIFNEIKILYYLNHDHIIKLYHVYTDENYLNLVMQFAQNSLFQMKQQYKIFKEKEIAEIMKQLINAIYYMHEKQIVHCDIKLENVMFSNGKIKLCDLGCARKINQSNTYNTVKNSNIIGTLEYLPPQYVKGIDSTYNRDIWALGILCLQMWIGKHPYADMRQNQKWQKIVKMQPKQFLDQVLILSRSNRKSIHIQQFLSKTLCQYTLRFNAKQLTTLSLFQCQF